MNKVDFNFKVSQMIDNPASGIEIFINNFYETLFIPIRNNISSYYIAEEPDKIPSDLDKFDKLILYGLKEGLSDLDYFFANTIKTEFNRGTIVWAAPYEKVCFKDVEGSIYYVCGKINTKPIYWIPEEYWDCNIREFFKHGRKRDLFSKNNIENNIRNYCKNKDYPVNEEEINKWKQADEFILYNLKSLL